MSEKPNYALAKKIPNLNVPRSATVVGTGGSGSWAALLLALAGCQRLVLFDGAVFKDTDVARIPISISAIGKRKPSEVKKTISRFRPDCDIKIYNRFFQFGKDESLIEGVLFNCADNMDAARNLSTYAREHNMPYFTAPYAGIAAATFDHCPDKLVLTGKSMPTWVGAGALAAALAVTASCSKSFNIVVHPDISGMAKGDLEGAIEHTMGNSSL